MANFKYKAQTSTGKTVTGKMQANDEHDLHQKLREDGKFLISATPVNEIAKIKPIKIKQVAEFSRQIGTLLGSGVSLVRALKIIVEDESITDAERIVYGNLLTGVRKGIPLSQAMQEQGGAFPQLLINMFQSAEVSGNMDKTALKMADHYTKEYHLNSKVSSAMVYPKILCVVIVLVVIVIMAFVVPQFQSMFDQMDSLPITTTILLGISAFVKKNWLILLIGAVILWLVLQLVFRIPKVRWAKDKFILYVPLFGKLERVIFTARFARTLSSLYTAGIPIVTTLQIAKNTIGNSYIEGQFDDMIQLVRTGMPLNEALDTIQGFTNKLVASIRIGEETGKLDTMLVSAADNLDYEADMAIQKLVSYIEPVMIIVMALIVGFIMISVIQPIYGSYETIGAGTDY